MCKKINQNNKDSYHKKLYRLFTNQQSWYLCPTETDIHNRNCEGVHNYTENITRNQEINKQQTKNEINITLDMLLKKIISHLV